MEFNKNTIVLVSTLSILLLSFQAEGNWFPRVFKHVSSSDDDMNAAAPSPSYAPGPSPVPSSSHISSSPSSADAPAPESISPSIAASPEYVSPATSPATESPVPSQSSSATPATPPPEESSSLSASIPDVKLPCGADSDVWSCVSDISSVLNGNDDQFSILKTGIQAAIAQAKQVIVEAQENADGQGCTYDNAVDDLQESMKAAEGQDMGKIISMLQAAQDDVASCGGTAANEELQQLIKTCLTIGEAVELTNLNF